MKPTASSSAQSKDSTSFPRWLVNTIIALIAALSGLTAFLVFLDQHHYWPFKTAPTSASHTSAEPFASPGHPDTGASEASSPAPETGAGPQPRSQRASSRSKLLIKGSFNEVYVYWGDVAVRREPFTVTATDEHSHIMLPDNLPVDIEFDGHDNVVWCHSRDMVGQIIGDGLRGNKFEVR